MTFPPFPRRAADFFKRMSTSEEDAAGELAAFVKYVLPVVEAYHQHMVDSGWNFSEKA